MLSGPLIAVVNQDDLTITLILGAVGISPPFRKGLSSLQEKYPGGATQFQFWLANFLRLSEGLLVVVVSFFFIVQADNVLDIFLNFAAIEFVAELDNLGHRIAAEGWIGAPIKDLAKNLKDATLPAKKAQQKWTCNVNRILLLVLLLVLYVCWGVLERWQTLGQFLEQNACKTLRIGFGDEVYYLPPGTRFDVDEDDETKIKESDVSSVFELTARPPNLHYAYFSGKYNAFFDKNDKAGVKSIRPVYYEDGGDHPPTDPVRGML
jgi:hypothetical protein